MEPENTAAYSSEILSEQHAVYQQYLAQWETLKYYVVSNPESVLYNIYCE